MQGFLQLWAAGEIHTVERMILSCMPVQEHTCKNRKNNILSRLFRQVPSQIEAGRRRAQPREKTRIWQHDLGMKSTMRRTHESDSRLEISYRCLRATVRHWPSGKSCFGSGSLRRAHRSPKNQQPKHIQLDGMIYMPNHPGRCRKHTAV